MKLNKVELIGLKDLEKLMLETLPAETSRKVTLQAMRDAAKPMVEGAKAKAKRGQSDALSESIGTKTLTARAALNSKYPPFASLSLGPRSGVMTAWAKYLAHYGRGIKAKEIGRIRHGHLVEFGFRHKSGKHVPPRPFLRPAFDIHSADFLRYFKGHLKRRIERAGAKSRNGI